ncbi:DUF4407 domain-containing protein [Micromonospora sp. B006]|uniref:DUF4407 domain-containing protein n=1 Tax=Micromonospora sp. B006 TaxID=2201999 RepID=UPI000E309515|nr:DUF4407 domain-containing protein [Micromonospora sp. B006]AXO36733.1 hypothetical protein MicB006_4466 [Micromonospora sp. B006]
MVSNDRPSRAPDDPAEADERASLADIAGRPEPAPMPPRWGTGRLLRRFSGVDEKLLAWVPQERARYTGMGGAVLCTALMAFGSMSVALFIAFPDARAVGVLPAAALWFLLILNFDRWLVATPLAAGGSRKFGTVLVRMSMAFVFGVVIAEPLVLVVFHSAVDDKATELRQQEVNQTRARWERCSPLDVPALPAASGSPSGSPSASPSASAAPASSLRGDCDDYTVPTPERIRALQNEYVSKQQALADLQTMLTPLQNKHNALVEKSQDECLGKPGRGHTGQYGDGPVCKRLTKDAVEYARNNQLSQLTSGVTQLTGELQTLTGKIREASDEWLKQRQQHIDEQVRLAQQRVFRDDPGLLERIEALNRLATEHAALAIGIWVVRALFVLVDLAPALVKFNSGATTYDRLAQRSLNLGEMQYSVLALEETTRAHRWAEDQRESLDVERARSAAERAATYDSIVDELERHWARATVDLPHPASELGDSDRGQPMTESIYSYAAEHADHADPPLDQPYEDGGPSVDPLIGHDPLAGTDGPLRRSSWLLPRMNVVTLGGVGVGKTALMAVMFAELEDDERQPGRGYRIVCPDAEQRDLLAAQATAVRAAGFNWPEHTGTTAVQEYEFDCLVRVDQEELPVLRLRYLDYAGELIESGLDVDPTVRKELANQVGAADAVLLMVDGVRLREAEVDEEQRVDFSRLLNTCVQWVEGARCPVQVVVTKWDCLEGTTDPGGWAWSRDRLVVALERYPAMRRLAGRHLLSASGGGSHRGLRVIPVSVVGVGAVQEHAAAGYPLMEKVRQGTPVNVDVPFAGLLPDRLLQILDQMGHTTLRRRLRIARRRRLRYRAMALLTGAKQMFRGLTVQFNVGVASVGWQHQAATDPNAGWLASGVLEERLVMLRRDISRDAEIVESAQALRRRADWSLRAKLRVLECFTRRLAGFDHEFPGRGLRNTTVGE